MGLTLETGNTGYDVTAESDGALYASILGLESYVTTRGEQFEAEIQSNNAIRIGSGDAVLNGRHFIIHADDSEIVTINSGTTGYNRIDLICVEYTKQTDGVESGRLSVIQGSETTGTPTVPDYTDGDILTGATLKQYPLYKVTIAGVNIIAVDRLFNIVGTIHGLSEDLDQHSHESVGTPSTKLYPRINSGVTALDFGGTGTQTAVYVGNSPVDGRPIPTSYQFGANDAPATVTSGELKIRMKDSAHAARNVASSSSNGAQMNIGDSGTNTTLLKGNSVYIYPEEALYLEPYKGANGHIVVGSTGSAVQLRPQADNKHTIGTSAYRFNNVYSVNGVTTSSDRRKKKNISEDFAKLKTFFKKLRPVSYEYNDVEIDRERIGFIAQDVEDALTESELNADKFAALNIDEQGFYSLNYSEFIALNTKMIQELQTEVEELKREVRELRGDTE